MVKTMICVECGRKQKIFRNGTCIDCFLKTHSFTKANTTLNLLTCTHCGSYKYKNTWATDLFDDLFKRIIRDIIQISHELKGVRITNNCKKEKENLVCSVNITGYVDNVELTEEHIIFIHVKKAVCDICSKRLGGYYEAIIQIRRDKGKLTKEEMNNIRVIVEGFVENLRAKGNRGLFITDIGIEHGRLDIYISEKGAAMSIAKKLYDRFGGEMKQSTKTIGMKDSKILYRMTYLVRLSAYNTGSIISLDKNFYLVASIQGHRIRLVALSTWDERMVDHKQMEKAQILGRENLIHKGQVVSQTENEVQIMDSTTFNITVLRKPKIHYFKEVEIKIVKINDQIFLYPQKK